jgi:hypothetical protein
MTQPDLDAFRNEIHAFVRASLPADIARKVASSRELTKTDYVRSKS